MDVGNGNKKGGIPLREEIPADFKWKLELMYADDSQWEADFQQVRNLLPRAAELKGTLGSSPDALFQVLSLRDEIERLAQKLYAYARMRLDEDNTRSFYQELSGRAQSLSTDAGAALSYITPEILSVDEESLTAFLQEEKLALYRHHIDDITRLKEHVLSDREEELLSMAGEVLKASDNIYTMLSKADLSYPSIKNEEGELVELTPGRYLQFLQSPERQVRRDAFEGIFSSFNSLRNSFSAALSAEVKKNIFLAKARRYPSALELYLDYDNIPAQVYHNVIDTVNNNLEPLHRYLDLKKKVLGIEKVHFYDLYVPLISPEAGSAREYPYQEARKIILEALQPMGEEYVNEVNKGFDGGWVDVYENKGKSSGAYSYGTYQNPPYILLNYTGTIDSLFTLAHELGHSMHSYYSRKVQPFVYADYTLFSAEVASTVNEALLVNHLLQIASPEEKALITNHYLEAIRATFYRQALFAEFELKIHTLGEQGESMTPEKLSALWLELNQRYYGADFATEPLLGVEWARIPHFYLRFYVYKYVTGLAAGTSLATAILREGKPARDSYLEFLKKGSSDYTLNILKETGVDMSTPAPLEDTAALFTRLLDELSAP